MNFYIILFQSKFLFLSLIEFDSLPVTDIFFQRYAYLANIGEVYRLDALILTDIVKWQYFAFEF